MSEDQYEKDQLAKVATVVRAATQNGACKNDIQISTTGHEPSASVVVPAYILAKALKIATA